MSADLVPESEGPAGLGPPSAGPQGYTHHPKPIGSPVSFVLRGDRLFVDSGRKTFDVRLGAVQEVRMSYEPGRMSRRVFKTRLRLVNGRTVGFSSLSWKSLMEAQELGPAYRQFAGTLIRAVAAANPAARFTAGQPLWRWILTAATAGLCLATTAFLVWRALQMGATALALLGAAFAAVGIWQLEPMVRLNRPRPFDPDRPPPELMPPS